MPFFLLGLYLYILRRVFGLIDGADEHHWVKTCDGVSLAVARYRPRGVPRRTAPILMVHGLGANRFNFDLNEEYSLARYLAGEGHDCWLVDLRGCGESLVSRAQRRWNFDDHVFCDVPAVLDLMESCTGHRKTHWLGHSMGGMMLYAYLLRGMPERIESGITLAAPACFSRSAVGGLFLLGRGVQIVPRLPLANLVRMAAPFLGHLSPKMMRLQMNMANIDRAILRGAAFNTASHLSTGVLAQFLDWMQCGEFRSADRTYSYTANLDQIETPLLVLAGRADAMVPACDAKRAFECARTQHKHYVEYGAESGHADDYGHIDLVFGRRARTEVFPEIARWLGEFEGSSEATRASSAPPSGHG
jgi:pimeloyl-ACP methyl ester carboxylesterase